jgi:4-diphosphocytidyl-2-C-methyl-D-erythritol kinase
VPSSIARRAAAKINLALHVIGRRADSYHELDTIAVFADVGDDLSVTTAEDLRLSISGRFAGHAPAGETNLVLRAAEALRAETGYSGGAEIRLEKKLPAGAGFGGGSADAAAALDALNALWGLRIASADLMRIGESSGADVPMCLAGRALRARGKGEDVTPINGWPALPLILVWPRRPVSTAEIFGALHRRENAPLAEPPAAASPGDLAEWLAACRNDLEGAATNLAPEIGEALAALRATPGCLLARMSGSGSGCFGLYGSLDAARDAATAVAAAQPGWWVAATLAR